MIAALLLLGGVIFLSVFFALRPRMLLKVVFLLAVVALWPASHRNAPIGGIDLGGTHASR